MFIVCCPCSLGTGIISEEISFFRRFREAAGSFSFYFRSSYYCDMRSLAANENAMLEKLGTDQWKKLHKAKKEPSSIYVVGRFKPRIA